MTDQRLEKTASHQTVVVVTLKRHVSLSLKTEVTVPEQMLRKKAKLGR